MKSELRPFVVIALLLGALGGIYYYLGNSSIEVWYGMGFTEWKSNFLSFHNKLAIIAFIIGMLVHMDSFKYMLWIVITILLALFNSWMIITGYVFASDVRVDEFVLYFPQIQTTWIAYLFLTGMFCRHLLNAEFTHLHKNLVILSIPFVGLVFQIATAMLSRYVVDKSHDFLWISLLLTIGIFWISSRTSNPTKS